MTDIRVKIDELSPYDDLNNDKSKKNLYEVSKNTGTYSSPLYATNGSRKITQEQLREELNIKEYLVRDFVVINSGGTVLEDKVNAIVVSADASFTLPTASSSNYGKSIVITNRSTYTVTINGIVNGSTIKLTNFNEVIQLACLFDGTSTYGWWLISDAITDKICTTSVTLVSNTHTAKHNENIKADALSIGSDVNITIPTAGIEGRLIYVYYPTGSPSAFVVELIGGFTATLVQGDYFLIRDNGSYWEAISTSQNTAPTPTLDTVTGAGDTTTNSVTVGGLVVDMPSGSGVAVDITKSGNGEALTVNKTSGSGNVASFTGGVTSIQDVEITSATANVPAFFDSAKKLVIATGALLGTWFQTLTADTNPIDADTIVVNDSTASFEAKRTTLLQLWTNYLLSKVQALGYLSGTVSNNTIPKGNGAGGLVNSSITDNGTTVTIAGNVVVSGLTTDSAITGGTVNANNILRTPVLATDTVTILDGSLWYNTFSNAFKGFVNGIVVTFMTSRMPANTIKTNNTGSTADAVDLALTTETVLGRTAGVNSGNIAPLPLQASISAETTLVAGTRTITDSRVTANTIVIVSPSNTGTLTQQIRYTKNVGVSVVFNAGGSDTCTFSYAIIF